MSEGIIDFAGLEPAAGSETPVETPSTDTNDSTVQTTAGEQKEGSEKEGAEGKEQGGAEKSGDALNDEKSPLPAKVREQLKAWRDADPENKEATAAVKTLHQSYERWNAAKQIFPKGVAEMKDAAAFIQEIGGKDGWATTQQTLQSVQESDELLYAGDGKLIDNIVEDLKSAGKIDALGKMAPAFLDALKANDQAGYYSAFAPHFLEGMQQSGVPTVINSLARALASGNVESAKGLVKDFADWYNGLNEKATKAKVDPLAKEKQELAAQRTEFEQSKVREAQTEIAKEAERSNNSLLGTQLKEYLRMPFFKGFSRDGLQVLGGQIKADLYSTLKSDKTYQAWMKAQWSAKSPDKGKIIEYHKTKVESLATDVVRRTVQRMYPMYAKGGAAAGRVAAADAKKTATQKVEQKAAASGKPIYVAQKPAWDAIDFEKDPKQLLYISGKAYLKGSGKLVTWRR